MFRRTNAVLVRTLFGIVFAVCVFFLPDNAEAQSASEGLYIDNFSTSVDILDDSWLQINETIDVNFIAPHHGIYRYIPYRYHDKYGNVRNIRIEILDVVDDQGQRYEYSKSLSDGNVLLKIGDPNFTLTGDNRYVISYRVWGAVNYFDNEAEFYWNATGNEWLIPIYNAEARVNINDDQCLETTGFQGYTGSGEEVIKGFDSKCSWMASRELSSGEGLTIVARWPKDLTPPPSAATKIGLWLIWNWVYFIPVLAFVLVLIIFLKKGLDPKGRGTIVAEFESPDNLTPLEVGTLYDNKAEGKDFSAMIIDFAVNGYLKIKEIEKKSIFGGKDYEFEKVKSLSNNAMDFEKKIYNKIFENGTKIKLSDLNEKFYQTKKDAEKDVFKSLVEKGYYEKSPLIAGLGNYVVGGAFIFLGFFASAILEQISGIGYGASMISFIISGVIIVVFGVFMSKRTKKGAETREKIAGLKLYLKTAEKYRMKFAEKEKIFEHFLPYAMALGVAEIWAKKFKNIYKEGYEPDWYSGYRGNVFTAYAFTRSLNSNFSANVRKSFSSTPASSGSSGFSGSGGFSGGGGGGGGGGGW